LTLATSQFLLIAKDVISQCPSDVYVIATQPGVHASDFRNGHAGVMRVSSEAALGVGMPHLKRALHEERGQLIVPYARRPSDVDKGEMSSLGGEIAVELGEWARQNCGAEVVEVDASTGSFERFGDMKPKVLMVNLEKLSEDPVERAQELANTDAFLFSIIDSFPVKRFTLIYTSTPRPLVDKPLSRLQELYSPHTSSYHELRRRSSAQGSVHEDKSQSANSTGSLFQRYAFFSTGIFHGYIVVFFLGTIVFLGLKTLLSLKVTYAAFEKEMGPAAAKKQQ